MTLYCARCKAEKPSDEWTVRRNQFGILKAQHHARVLPNRRRCGWKVRVNVRTLLPVV